MINLNSENVLFVNHYGECGVSNINQIFCCVIILTYFDAKCQGIYNKNHLQILCITHIYFWSYLLIYNGSGNVQICRKNHPQKIWDIENCRRTNRQDMRIFS